MAIQVIDVEARLDRLVGIASPYWAGEHEVVITFFSRPHSREEHIHWLRAQCWKEFWGHIDERGTGTIERMVTELGQRYPDVQRGDLPHRFLHVAQELYAEFHHYQVLSDILDDLERRRVPPDELKQMPEDLKLAQMRAAAAATHGEMGAAISKFSEGGGSSMYKAGMEIRGGELEQRIATACRIIYDDEVDHMRTGAEGLRRTVKTAEDWSTVERLTREIARQRVRMRNEMFGYPLSEERLHEIDSGRIEPLHRDILK